jgi:SAM-dependent MidA family methyltransferase
MFGMTTRQIILEKISEKGPISFEHFMELALYHPEKGYYNQPGNPIGSTGDFYTMPHLTPVIGVMIARQLKEMWELLGRPNKFTIVEMGAGNSHLCRSILQSAKSGSDFSKSIHYIIVEQSYPMTERAKAIVPANVQFCGSLEDQEPIFGCILSNELFDNIPFTIAVKKDVLMEVYVGCDIDFFEILKPASDATRNFVQQIAPGLPDDFRIEVGLKATGLIRQLASKLEKGFLLTIDYGFRSSELLTDHRRGGTLNCYYRHQTHHNPFIHIGEQDITSHVNFSALSHFGEISQLHVAGYVCQANFLRALGLLPFLASLEHSPNKKLCEAARYVSDLLLFKTADKFKVLIQYKGLPFPKLTGLLFAEPLKRFWLL